MNCDLHPDCMSQGCQANPDDCQRVRDLKAQRAAADVAWERLDDTGKFAKLEYHLRAHHLHPVPRKWVIWLLQYVRAPTTGPGVLVNTQSKPKSGWERS